MIALTFACAGAPPLASSMLPEEVVEAQVRSLHDGDELGAYLTLTEEARARAHRWPLRDELPEVGSAREARRTASWPGGERALTLERGAEGWRIRDGVLGLLRARTPEEALRTLARAILSSDWDTLLTLMPERQRAGWSPSRLGERLSAEPLRSRWIALAQAIRDAPPAVVRVGEDRAIWEVDGTRVVLVSEGAAWKVFDVTPAKVYTGP